MLAPGSLYTSLLPVLCVAALRGAVAGAGGRVVQVANLRPQPPETDGLDATDHLRAVLAHGVRVDTLRLRGRQASSPADADRIRAWGVEPVGGARGHATAAPPTTPCGWRRRFGLCCSRLVTQGEARHDSSCRNQRLRADRPLVHRALLARGADAGVELVAVNDPMGDSDTMAFLLKHDSVGGTLHHEVKPATDGFSIDGREVPRSSSVMDPAEIPWADHGVDVVIESTGIFTAREKAAGAPRRQRRSG